MLYKKRATFLVWALSLTMFSCWAFGQQANVFQIPLKSGPIQIRDGQIELTGGRYAILQFTVKLTRATVQNLNAIGIRPLSLLYMNAWLCAVEPTAFQGRTPQSIGIAAAIPWRADYKIDPALRRAQAEPWALTRDRKLKLLVTFFEDLQPTDMQAVLARYDSSFQLHRFPNVWAVVVSLVRMEDLLREPQVQAVEAGPAPALPLNDKERAILHVDGVQDADLTATPPLYHGLSGAGVNVAVTECDMDKNHPDFWNHNASGGSTTSRVQVSAWCHPTTDTTGQHSTVVAGTLGGNGWNSARGGNSGTPYQWRGMAPESMLISGIGYPFQTCTGTTRVDASNHSYASLALYDGEASAVDQDIRGARGPCFQKPHVWAAGNYGRWSGPWGLKGYYSVFGSAKNTIAVGAVNANDGSLASFSSLGPAFDGRIKPDVVAGGSTVFLPRSSVTVNIDFIRIIDDSGNTVPSGGWEFNTDGNFEAWLAPLYGILNAKVAGGVWSFQIWDGAYSAAGPLQPGGAGQPLDVQAHSNQSLVMRYRIDNRPATAAWNSQSILWWRRAGSSEYVDGQVTASDIRADGAWHTVSFPVGTESAWNGTIEYLQLAPLAASGGGIVTTQLGSGGYIEESGTSIAAPAVTGIVALMLQQFVREGKLTGPTYESVDLNSNPPLPSTVKAILIQTAHDLVHTTSDLRDPPNPDTGAPVLYDKGPDFATGYGLVDAEAAVKLIEDAAQLPLIRESSLAEERMHIYELNLTSPVALRMTLVWDDVEGSASIATNTPVLVNDLDLVLIDPLGNRKYPWTLDPLPTCFGTPSCVNGIDPIRPQDVKPARKAPDHRNNVEQVEPDVFPIGKWQAVVVGYNIQNVPQGGQTYSLVSNVPLEMRADLLLCDANADNQVDQRDIAKILADRNSGVRVWADPRDADLDGYITVLDARACALRCTKPQCAQ